MRATRMMWLWIARLLVVLMMPAAANAGAPVTGCCLREFSPSGFLPTTTCVDDITFTKCFEFAGVGVIDESFEAGKVCASDGRSCVAAQEIGINLDLGLGRPPADPELPQSILLYPSFDAGQPATIALRAINTTSSTLTHVTVRIFQGNDEVLNDENVLFMAGPGGGFLLQEETTLPDETKIVGALVCWATGEMAYGDCPEYPTDVTGSTAQLRQPQGPVEPQVFTALAFGVLLQSGEIRGAPVADAGGLAVLSAILLALGAYRQRRRLER